MSCGPAKKFHYRSAAEGTLRIQAFASPCSGAWAPRFASAIGAIWSDMADCPHTSASHLFVLDDILRSKRREVQNWTSASINRPSQYFASVGSVSPVGELAFEGIIFLA